MLFKKKKKKQHVGESSGKWRIMGPKRASNSKEYQGTNAAGSGLESTF